MTLMKINKMNTNKIIINKQFKKQLDNLLDTN